MHYTPKEGEIVLAIDLGTTNTCCCVYDGIDYRTIDINGTNLLPSYVWYKNDGSVVCGSAAKTAMKRRNVFVVCNSKRIIGRPYASSEVQKLNNYCGTTLVDDKGVPKFVVSDNGERVSSTEVATEIIKEVLDQVRKAYPGKTIARAIITTPAYFNANQKSATLQAAINAGFAREQIDTLNEPTAAAICYCLENNSVDEKILVYDLGGGTFDVSLLRVHNNEFVVLGCDGDNAFGGVDIDKCVMELLMEKYEAKFGAPLVSASMEEKKKTRYNRQIQAMSEHTKIILSTTSETSVDFSELDHVLSTENNDDDQLVVTREEMEGAIRPLIDKTIITLRHLLSEAEVAAKDVDSVVIVGGSSHIPLVRETLRREFGDAKVTLGVDPSECVARGGCVSIVKGVRSQELATFSLGTSLENNEVMWIIPYHSPLPVAYTTSVMTAEDYAEQVRTNVVEGHGSTSGLVEMVTPDMVTLPMYSFTGFPRRPKGEVAFDITYTMKENGTLFITAKEKATGRVLLDSFEVTCFEWFCVLQQTRTLLALSRGLDASGSSSRLHHLRPVLSSLRRLLER